MKLNRKIYLNNIDADIALETFLEAAAVKPQQEVIPAATAVGRVSANAVFARQSSPNFNASAMDGIAVVAQATFGASEKAPKILKEDEFEYIDTGDVMHDPYNAVIMIEDIQPLGQGAVQIIAPASPWQHVRPMGEDIVAREIIIPANHTLSAVDIGALLAGGVVELSVFRQPRVGILPTGTEVIEPGEACPEGCIIESNSRVFEALSIQYGARPNRHAPVPDNYQVLKAALLKLTDENDFVIINAGSSAGREDFTAPLIEELGQLLVHGIATKPGKPTVLGLISGKPIIGIPGYPVAAFFIFETFARPLIAAYFGRQTEPRPVVEATLSRRLISSVKHKEFVPVKLGVVEGKRIATPLNRGAGTTMSLVRADGLLVIPQNVEGIEAGSAANIQLMHSLDKIENTLVSIGSHDLIMDMIGSMMQENGKYFLSSSHVGSMGGLMALRRHEAHIAPIHLLDEESGQYNHSFIQRYLPDREVALIKGIQRIQGFIVASGNPKGIESVRDLCRQDIVYVNRQRGAGTRLLLDYMIKQHNLDSKNILGYEREMTTHMAVAAAVASGSADTGMGVQSAAEALGLDFIPVGVEDYDFAVPKAFLDDDRVMVFLAELRSERFAAKVAELGGYIIPENN